MSSRYLFFDLDGTLVNSEPGILRSVTYALERMQIPIPPRERLLRFIGPPLIRTFSEDYHLTQEEAQRAVALYREYYSVKGIFECELYGGVRELLQKLHRDGEHIVLATCKPTVSARRVIEYFGLSDCFDMISGPELDGTRNEKHEVIDYATQALGVKDPSRILMIGDRRDDVLGAKRNGIACIGVLWGYGSARELTDAGAVRLVQSPDELSDFLEDWTRLL